MLASEVACVMAGTWMGPGPYSTPDVVSASEATNRFTVFAVSGTFATEKDTTPPVRYSGPDCATGNAAVFGSFCVGLAGLAFQIFTVAWVFAVPPDTLPEIAVIVCGPYTVVADAGLLIMTAGAPVWLSVIGGTDTVARSVVAYRSVRVETNRFAVPGVRKTFGILNVTDPPVRGRGADCAIGDTPVGSFCGGTAGFAYQILTMA
jgi:hypothetical protein